MAKKRIKLVDIANELGVSVGLVSIVLSGKSRENRISDTLSKKVIEKAKELGYQANQMARALRTGKSGIIGLAVADIANPYFGKMARFIENEASGLGYQVMFGSSDEDPKKLNDIINVFLSRQVDAMLIVPVKKSQKYLMALQEQSIPFVFVDRCCDGVSEDAVTTNNFEGGYQLCNVLIKRGYKKIGAFVYDTGLTNNNQRIKGYTSALKESELNDDSENLIFETGFKHVETRLESMLKSALKKGCDAFFFANNKLGIQSLKYFDKMNIKIPQDIGIVSFDNPESFQVAKPGVTCFEQPIANICVKAISILVDKMDDASKPKVGEVLLSGNLIIRESC
ncbi:LacI family DNA-binding transcriptional regulator [Saccharicrinis sp. GN24d3]|uniref:LacI family DNA-binding transcriptional regulator n=1 Tax=Saccharicrinis sp. GN24d3 TaxID=3458416 RepID=UPI0040370BAF